MALPMNDKDGLHSGRWKSTRARALGLGGPFVTSTCNDGDGSSLKGQRNYGILHEDVLTLAVTTLLPLSGTNTIEDI